MEIWDVDLRVGAVGRFLEEVGRAAEGAGPRRESPVRGRGLGGDHYPLRGPRRFLRVPGADRSLAVSDEEGACKIGYRWAPRVTRRMVLLLSYLWNSTRTDAPSGSLGRGTGKQ